MLGDTTAEAEERLRELQLQTVRPSVARAFVEQLWNRDLSEYDVDGPLPTIDPLVDAPSITNGRASIFKDPVAIARQWRELSEAKGLSIRELVISVVGRSNFVGTPEHVAAEIDHYVQEDASDGFILVPHLTPHGLDEFVEKVVPLLQERGSFRTSYEGSTLREHLGLPLADAFGRTLSDSVHAPPEGTPKMTVTHRLLHRRLGDLARLPRGVLRRAARLGRHHLPALAHGASPSVFDEFPGRWTAAPGDVLTVEAAAADGLVLPEGDVVDGVATLDPVEGGPGLRVRSGDLILEVARRTAHVIIRVHDPRAPQLAAFTGIPAYAPDTQVDRHRHVRARSTHPARSRRARSSRASSTTTPPSAPCTSRSRACRSRSSCSTGATRSGVLFRDATSGVTTYPASRTLALGELARRHRHAGLQPREQPAVRPDRVRDLPGAARRERADRRGRGRRAVGALIS